jgi:WXG100 family type VII secretion target
MAQIVVTPEVAAAPARLHQDSATFGAMVANLYSQVTELQSSWKGFAAQQQFTYYTIEWDTAATALFGKNNSGGGVLDQIAMTLTTVAGNYDNVETTNQQGWKH